MHHLLNIDETEESYIVEQRPFLWINSQYGDLSSVLNVVNSDDILQANQRLLRFSPILQKLFPELESSDGIIESPLIEANSLKKVININGRFFVKADNNLPIAGSIKARGGIYEVLCFVEDLALENNLISNLDDDYQALITPAAQAIFNQYTISVGSTGNLGLSIGIASSALGFNTLVHMSSDAKEWKKKKLRDCGVKVIEYDSDYSIAVNAGRLNAQTQSNHYFIDDESSPRLFMGYAVAALRLKKQLDDQDIVIDQNNALFVYLPAGVGGAPGGITFGLKSIFGDNVHCFFAEPVQAPCMMLGMAGNVSSEPLSVYDFGLTIDTDADGLAVGTASKWVCDTTRHLISGIYTATDNELYQQLFYLKEYENIKVEPSAAISCIGPSMLNTVQGKNYLKQHNINASNITHISWLTGGSLVPETEYTQYLNQHCKK